jgi:hypothetical protein
MYIPSGPFVGVGVTDVIVTSTSPCLLQENPVCVNVPPTGTTPENGCTVFFEGSITLLQPASRLATAQTVKMRRMHMDGIVQCAA